MLKEGCLWCFVVCVCVGYSMCVSFIVCGVCMCRVQYVRHGSREETDLK